MVIFNFLTYPMPKKTVCHKFFKITISWKSRNFMLIRSKWEGGAGHLFRFTLRYFSWYILEDIQWFGSPIRKKAQSKYLIFVCVFLFFNLSVFLRPTKNWINQTFIFFWVTYIAFCRTIIQNVFFGTIFPKNVSELSGHGIKSWSRNDPELFWTNLILQTKISMDTL